LHGESFGVVLLEAMAAGTPVVASGLDGYRNVATDGVNSLLVEPGDVGALSAALRTVLFDRDMAERLRRAGLQRADEFSMTELAQRYVELYRRVIVSDWKGRRPSVPNRARPWRSRMLAAATRSRTASRK
jgi:phosphatidylinositol alpha-mannosyltransferase